MIKRYFARRHLLNAVAHHERVIQARENALQSDAPSIVLDAYDVALTNAQNRWAGAVRALAMVS